MSDAAERPSLSVQAYAWICIGLIGAVRLLTLGIPGLIDPSDARYAVIAENMVRSGDWISVRAFQDGHLAAYWSKPPLAFWLAAISIEVFGLNAWAVRFPTFLATFATALWLIRLGRIFFSELDGLTAAAFYLTCGLIFMFTGSVLLDPLLTFFVTAAVGELLLLISGVSTHTKIANLHRYITAGFLCGLGFLTKGPIAIAFPAMIAVGLVFVYKNYRVLLHPMVWGGITACVLTLVPWLYLNEKVNPGFLRYFFWEENFHRFSSHQGKLLNGTLHPSFRGASILYFLIAILPWGVSLFFMRQWQAIKHENRSLFFALLVSALLPVLFLAIGKQVLIYYVMPFVPPFMLLCARVCNRAAIVEPHRVKRLTLLVSIVAGVILFGGIGLSLLDYRQHDEAAPLELFFVIMCSAAAIIWTQKNHHLPAPYRWLQVSVLMTFAYGALTIGTAPGLENKKSTKLLFAELQKQKLLDNLPIYFFAEVPDSAYHYLAASKPGAFAYGEPISLIEENSIETISHSHGVLIARDKNSQRASQVLHVEPDFSVGKWRVYVPR